MIVHQQLTALALATLLCAGCGPSAPPPALPDYSKFRGQERFGLGFEQRMAIPAELSRLRADAQARADEMYEPFRSKEDAIRNEEMRTRLFNDAKAQLLLENKLTPEQLDEIVYEYQLSLGGNLR